MADSNPPCATEMPPCLSLEVLDHDAGKHNKLGIDAVENAVVREVKAVGDLNRDPP